MAARARFPFDERRRTLLQVGLAAFSSRPYDEVSMDQLAAMAGVSKGLLYHYFPTKRDFYREVLVAAVEDMRQLTEPDPALPPPEQLRAGLVAFLDYARDHAAGFSALLRGGIGSDPEIARVVADFRRAVLERVLGALGIVEPSRARPRARAVVRSSISRKVSAPDSSTRATAAGRSAAWAA